PVWLGLFVLCGAQISWFFLAIVPALSFLAAPGISSLRDFLRKWWQFPGPRWVALGALLGAAIFLLQLWFYTSDSHLALDYLASRLGSAGDGASRLRMATIVVARNIFFVGPALAVGC